MLKSKPKTLLGSEMIFEIASSLQDILDNTWIDPKESIPLDEERAVREQVTRVKALQNEERQRLKDMQAQQEEELLLQELVDQRQTQTTKRNIEMVPMPNESDNHGTESPATTKFERQSSVKEPHGRMITLTSVQNSPRYSLGPVCELFTVQANGQFRRDSTSQESPFLILKQSHFSQTSGNEHSNKRLVQNLESKLDYHTGLSPHQSITKPINFRIQRSSDGWNVSILMEMAERKSLRETLDIVDKLEIRLVRAWSIQLIEGLQHYHRHGSAHANLHLGNILLRRDREAERANRKITIATLSDGGYEYDLHILKKGASPKYFPIAWSAPEIVNADKSVEPIPATDVWDFGRCFLQMAFGVGIISEHPSGPSSIIEDLRLTSSLKALLGQIFNSNPKKRPSAWDLLHFEFFRNEDELLEGERPHESISLEASNLSLPSHLARSRHESVPASLSNSRYAKDFVEDGRLGRGGFGEVFRARNKVDGQPYAIKKIKARSKAALDPVLSEVTVLSRLNHPNVVRYFASWIEDGVLSMNDKDESDPSDFDFTSSSPNSGHRSVLPPSSRGLDFISSTNAQVLFANYDEAGEGSSGVEEDGHISESDDEDSHVASPEIAGTSLRSFVFFVVQCLEFRHKLESTCGVCCVVRY